jgi:hypothetical protein
VVLVAALLMMLLFPVGLLADTYASVRHASVGRPSVHWMRLAVTAIWGLLIATVFFVTIVPGLVLCLRPALFALIGPASGLPRWSSARRWPRLTGLAFIWAGAGVIFIASSALSHAFRTPQEPIPIPSFSLTALVGIFGAAFGPTLILMLAAFLVRARA